MLVKKSNHKRLTLIKIIICLIVLDFAGIASYTGYLYFNTQQLVQKQKQAEIDRNLTIETIKAAKEAKKKEPVYITLPGASSIRAIVDDYWLTSSIWGIVNKTHSISIDYVPNPLKIPDVSTRTDKSDEERSVRSNIEAPLKDMFSAAFDAGYSLMIGSGYRSAALQKVYFDSYASTAGVDAANQSIALPGQSEHQTGLAVDISTVSRQCYLDECFADTDDGQWLTNNAYKYGFILRYPKGKEAITGYQYEPWHFRYVGVELATALFESNLTFDEAWPYLEEARATLIQNGAI